MRHTLVNVRDLLKVDCTACTLALPEVFGDSFLIEHNAIYKSVRTSAVECGFQYTTAAENELWSDYQLMSLACLDQLISTKCIPCYPTKRVLRKLNDQRSFEKPLPLQFFLMTLALNNHFHESSHAVGYHVLSMDSDLLNVMADSDREKRVWASLVTEALANTVEYIAWMMSSSLAERVFLRLNAPSSYEDPDLRAFAQYVDSVFGRQFLFERAFCSFLLGRLYSDIMSERRQADLASIFEEDRTEDEKKIAAIVLRTSKGLRADFREIVAPSYFSLLGLQNDYEKVIGRNVLLSTFGRQLRSFARECFELCCSRKEERV